MLNWFQRGWAAAADPATDLGAWVAAELGGHVYGLASIFEAAREHGLPAPATAGELGAALAGYLYAEGETVVEDDRVLVLTDDDEVELAYFFLPPEAGEQAPGRLAYLLHEDFPLPGGVSAGAGTFTAPAGVGTLAPAGTGEGTAYAVLLTFHDGHSIGWLPPVAIPGERLPGLAEYLRQARCTPALSSATSSGTCSMTYGPPPIRNWPPPSCATQPPGTPTPKSSGSGWRRGGPPVLRCRSR